MRTPPKYVIINDCDAPEPAMVCQWVPGVGYCYLDRTRDKPDFDGMVGEHATPVDTFGVIIHEGADGIVTFRATGKSFARYADGEPRRWQSPLAEFTHKRLLKKNVRKRKRENAA